METTLGIGSTSHGEHDRFAVLGLARLNIRPVVCVSRCRPRHGGLDSLTVLRDTYSSWGQSSKVDPENAVQLSPALAKLTDGSLMTFKNASGMIYLHVSCCSVQNMAPGTRRAIDAMRYVHRPGCLCTRC